VDKELALDYIESLKGLISRVGSTNLLLQRSLEGKVSQLEREIRKQDNDDV
jgi:hypothetical protein